MVDTIRDITALLALLADNTSGNISPQDLRDVLVSAHGCYGGMRTQEGSTAQASLGTTPAKVTGFASNSPSKGVVPDSTTDNDLTVPVAGDYKIHFDCSFSGTLSADFRFHLRIGGVENALACERKLGTGGDTGTTVFEDVVTLSANDILTVYVETDNASDTDTMTPVEMHFTATLIG